ncbi:MAG: zinc-dependent peptidase [Planctomycetota bacterium]|nr:zinc-dependent peptidase [Planctomycetota bacterium]
MLFSWLKRRRRRRLLARPFPLAWEDHVGALPFFPQLADEEKRRLRDILRVIVEEKSWEGCGGLEVDEEIQVTIAAQAALLILAMEHDHFRRVQSILVYPGAFEVPATRRGPGGVLQVSTSPVLGLAQLRGPVVLAWDEVRRGGKNWRDGRNVVLHEFAHKLDMLDNCADGTPPIRCREQYAAWVRIMSDEYEELVERAEKGKPTLLDKYGATNPAEFFAVSTECFFEKSLSMERKHPSLHDLLRTYYGQDPAARERRERKR